MGELLNATQLMYIDVSHEIMCTKPNVNHLMILYVEDQELESVSKPTLIWF